MEKAIARKQLKRTVEGNTETIVNEYHEFVFNERIHELMLDEFDDYESAAYNGVYGNIDDDIAMIDVLKCCEYLSERIALAKEEKERDVRCEDIYKYLKKWKGFEITL